VQLAAEEEDVAINLEEEEEEEEEEEMYPVSFINTTRLNPTKVYQNLHPLTPQ